MNDTASDDPFDDPRVAALYDLDNPPGDDHAHFRAVADRVAARVIVDLGCGTGSLTVSLVGDGRTVYGIDPAASMLDVARTRAGGDRVHWQQGDATALAALVTDGTVDLVTMTGNVAQHIIGAAWPETLAAITRALRPGGLVAFETRNPAAREWDTWTRDNTYGSRDTAEGRLTEWLDGTTLDDVVVSFTAHNVWESTGEHQALVNRLQFRTRDELTRDLEAAELTPTMINGGWHGEPVTDSSRLFVVTATKS
ncbi:class I SAM-dependent methyltransferase [Microlunatus soli]|uniref:class I SAM-dependent methyltransferase n=1 Tax=Microlunatus soli TaxID=630515 RepID=UPI001E41E543|nr:class I SAM-dependent methyltransferase [Microlunatus soli]